jgi:hypothetical protein
VLAFGPWGHSWDEHLNGHHIHCMRVPRDLRISFSCYAMLSKTPLADIEGPVWHRFVRFIADDGLEYCGQSDSEEVDSE